MQETTEPLQQGEIRVTSTEPVTGDDGDFELVAKHYDELRERVVQHRFVWEYTRTDAGEIEAYSFAWEPGHDEPLTPESDLAVVGYVEQYLDAQGMAVDGVLSEGMCRKQEVARRFEIDAAIGNQ